MKLHRLIALLGVCLATSTSALAQPDSASYPNRPIRLVVPLAAGGPTDLLARAVAQPLGQRLGQPIVIENRPGAGGNIGAEYVAHSDPDGYTLFLGTSGPLAINPSLYAKMRYDPVKDFAPIARLATAPFVVVTHPGVPVKSLPELIGYAKKNPGKLNYGVVTGNAAHLAVESFKAVAGLDITQIPYKGASLATNDLLAGQVDLSFGSTPGVISYINNGKLRAIAVTSPTRLKQLPNVPTVAESGFPGYEASVWYGLVAPAKTPPAVISKISKELDEIMKEKSVLDVLRRSDFEPAPTGPKQFDDFIRSENIRWREVVKKSGIHIG